MRPNFFRLALVTLFFALGLMSAWGQQREAAVAATSTVFRREVGNCQHASQTKESCLKALITRYLKRIPTEELFSLIKANEKDSVVFPVCHELVHYIGQGMQARYGLRGALGRGNEVCFGGYYHGVLEGYVMAKGNGNVEKALAELIPDIPFLCGEKKDFKRPMLYFECIHGIGHGLMFLTAMDLPMSLTYCDGFDDHDRSVECYSGVFMENSTSTTNPAHPSRWLKADDPLYPCPVLADRYRETCYKYQSSYVLKSAFRKKGENEWSEAVRLCWTMPVDFQDDCAFILGTSVPSSELSVPEIARVCSLIADTGLYLSCVTGAVVALTGWRGGDPADVLVFCRLVDREAKKACYTQAGKSFADWSENKAAARKSCDSIGEIEFLPQCLSGAGSE